MNKNYVVIGAIVVLLLVGGAVFAFRRQVKQALTGNQTLQQASGQAQQTNQTVPTAPSQPTSPTGTTMASVEVDYTATGFSPATVTVKKGTTVKFINKSDGQMEVASNPHPIHTDYPGFDQYKSAQKGQMEYDFTFEKVGTWGYHNHLNPTDTGTVVVTE